MKSVLISIKPKWCKLIASGEKTVEVRKTRPKIECPFKCYIYCTKPTQRFRMSRVLYSFNDNLIRNETDGTITMDDGLSYWANGIPHTYLNGYVIGEFVCDEIVHIESRGTRYITAFGEAETNRIARESCLDFLDMQKYLGSKDGFAWHISDLVIYDEPKELSEFWAYNEELHKLYDNDMDFCCYDGSNDNGEPLTDCDDAYNNILNCYRCWEEWSGWCHHVTRPPQSWCYVEEMKHGHWEYPFNKDIAKCSKCNFYVQDKINNVSEMYKYCPNCGARMDGE